MAVCGQPANTNTQPCSPLATLATSTSTTSGGANPLTADSFGNFFFYAAPGRYTVQIYGPAVSGQFVTPDVVLSCDPTGTCTQTGTFNCKDLQGKLKCVDSTNSQGWAGADVGAWINAAYAALPAQGGEIQVYNLGASCITFTTPILLTTAGKAATIRLMGSTAFSASLPVGACLNYTPTTSTTAITIDWGGTASFTANHGIIGLHLINNNCVTNGGCGSSATGIAMGTTNLGAPQAFFTNMSITGFGTGFSNANSLSFGQQFSNDIFASNTVGLNLPGGAGGLEREDFLTCHFNTNGSAITTTGATAPVNLKIVGGSFDSNTVIAVSNTSTGVTDFEGVHFENFGVACGAGIVPYVTTNNHLHIMGGDALDDCASNATPNTTAWFTANTIAVYGQAISAPTRTTIGAGHHVYNCTGGACNIHVENLNPANLNPYFPGGVVGTNFGGGQDPTFSTGRMIYAQASPPGTCSVPTGGGTGPTCTVNGGDSGGTIIMSIGTGAPAATGTTTFFFHTALTNTEAGNTAFCTFTLSDNGAGQWNGQAAVQEKTSTSAGVTIAWSNNAVALSTSTAYWINYTCGGR